MNRGSKGKKRLGDRGEGIACEHLMKLGHTILVRNYRYGHNEIDIITYNKNGIHFIEVKSRTAPIYSNPIESVNWKKQRNIIKTAKSFLNSKYIDALEKNVDVHFDIVINIFDGFKITTEYIEDAFYPIYT